MVCVEPARLSDADAIHALIDVWAQQGEMLERPLGEIHEAIRDFKVAREGGEVVGCGSLHIMGSDLAEIRSLAVREDQHGKGVGGAIVDACVSEGRAMGIGAGVRAHLPPDVLRAAGVRARERDGLSPEGLERVRGAARSSRICREIAVVRDLRTEAVDVPVAVVS